MRFLYQNLLNLRRLAIQNYLADDLESYIERCYRHYSKTYSVNLDHAKLTKTPEEVAFIYMEDEMHDWTPEQLEKVQAMLDNSDKPVLESGMAMVIEEVSDDEWIAQQEALAKAEEEKKQKRNEEIAKKTHEAIEELTQSFERVSKAVDKIEKKE